MWRVVLVLWTACYAPIPQAGAPCAANGQCPGDLVCAAATHTCELPGAGPRPDGPGAIDAPADDIDAPAAAPKLVQQASNAAVLATALAVELTSPPQPGNVLVMIGAARSGSLTTIAGGGVAWKLATQSLANANIEIWYGVTDGSTAKIEIGRPASQDTMFMLVGEWAGLDASDGVLDAAASGPDTTSPARSGAIETAHARDLLLFGAADNAPNTFGDPTPGAWTMMTDAASDTAIQRAWYRVVSATGTYAAEVSETAGSWDAAIAAFRIAE